MHKIVGHIGEAVAANKVADTSQHTDDDQKKRNDQPGLLKHQITQQTLGKHRRHAGLRHFCCHIASASTGERADGICDKTQQIDKCHFGKRVQNQPKDTDYKRQPVTSYIFQQPQVGSGASRDDLVAHRVTALVAVALQYLVSQILTCPQRPSR